MFHFDIANIHVITTFQMIKSRIANYSIQNDLAFYPERNFIATKYVQVRQMFNLCSYNIN